MAARTKALGDRSTGFRVAGLVTVLLFGIELLRYTVSAALHHG